MANVSPIEAAAALGNWERAMKLTIQATLRDGLARVRDEAIGILRATDMGRRLWSRGRGRDTNAGGFKTTVRSMLKVETVKAAGERYVTGIEIKGMPGLMETGGRTAAHPITAREPGARLKFQVGGRWRSVMKVMHKGSNIPKTAAVATALDRNEEQIGRDLQAKGDALVTRMLG